jgi:hypothetical protein
VNLHVQNCDLSLSPVVITLFIVSTFRDEFRRVGTWPRGCRVGSLPLYLVLLRRSPTSVKFCLSISEVHCFRAPSRRCTSIVLVFLCCIWLLRFRRQIWAKVQYIIPHSSARLFFFSFFLWPSVGNALCLVSSSSERVN